MSSAEINPVLPAIWLSVLMNVSKNWFIWIFFINLLVWIYKGINLPYAGPYLGLEITYYVLWGLISLLRYSIGSHALSRCDPVQIIFFIISTLFACLCCNLYFVRYQAYILRIELIMNSFCMAIEILEVILALVSMILYIKAQKI